MPNSFSQLTVNYRTSGIISEAFLESDAFIRGIRGPVGGGKTVVCVIDMLKTASKQIPGPDKVRRYRAAIIRNTYGELKTTSIKTFHDWVPEDYGKFRQDVPITHNIRELLPDGTVLDAEFIFLALDQPKHVKKLLSLELTQAFINEAREIPKAVLDHLTMRVGRYPRKEIGGAVRAGIIMDTNSPDVDHWWAKMQDHATPETLEDNRRLEDQLRHMGALRPDQPLVQMFTQPPAEFKDGTPNQNAENLDNLPVGYYVLGKVGKTQDWIKVYIQNEYGFVMDGKAIYEGYRDNLHCVAKMYNPNWPLFIGMDFGLTPAAVFGQRTPFGQVRALSEIVATRLGAKNFAREIKVHLAERYPGVTLETYNPMLGATISAGIGGIYGDPAGEAGAQTDETTVFQMLASEGVRATPAPTNDFAIRVESVITPMNRLIDGEPGMIIHPDCKVLRKACQGGYHYRRIQISGETRYDTKPNKNEFSHVAEGLQYMCCGMGEGKAAVKAAVSLSAQNRPAYANAAGDYPGPQSPTPYRAPRPTFATRD